MYVYVCLCTYIHTGHWEMLQSRLIVIAYNLCRYGTIIFPIWSSILDLAFYWFSGWLSRASVCIDHLWRRALGFCSRRRVTWSWTVRPPAPAGSTACPAAAEWWSRARGRRRRRSGSTGTGTATRSPGLHKHHMMWIATEPAEERTAKRIVPERQQHEASIWEWAIADWCLEIANETEK